VDCRGILGETGLVGACGIANETQKNPRIMLAMVIHPPMSMLNVRFPLWRQNCFSLLLVYISTLGGGVQVVS